MLKIQCDERFQYGYFIVYASEYSSSWFPSYKSDSHWIYCFEMFNEDYIKKLIELGAYNNCTLQFPSMFFKNKEDAEKAITEFYEPRVLMLMLAGKV